MDVLLLVLLLLGNCSRWMGVWVLVMLLLLLLGNYSRWVEDWALVCVSVETCVCTLGAVDWNGLSRLDNRRVEA